MLANKEGQSVPAVTFHTRVGDDWVDVTTDELFKRKKIILFALPGAFTPTCSSTHLPRYNELAPVFAKQGVDSGRQARPGFRPKKLALFDASG